MLPSSTVENYLKAIYLGVNSLTEPQRLLPMGHLAAALGVAPERSTVSTHCTRCGPGYFFSHRAGSPARQMGVLGLRE